MSAPVPLALHGQFEGGFGWAAHPGEFMARSSTAFASGGRVWLVDPLRAAGLEAELARRGRVSGVVLTVPWHDRDVAWFAAFYGVPVYVHRDLLQLVRLVGLDAPIEYVGARVPDSPLELVTAHGRGLLAWWKECGVWWPEHRALAVGDALGAASYFLLPGERLAVHPLRRLSPPAELAALRPERLYLGHGASLCDGAGAAVMQALGTARPTLASAWLHSIATTLRRTQRNVLLRLRKRAAPPS